MMYFVAMPELRKAVTFIPNKHEPIHNWYYFKEGFSKALVEYFIKNFEIRHDHIVFDPFCGVGTTLLACKQHNIESYGIDVSALMTFVAKTKTADYDLVLLKDVVNTALSWKVNTSIEMKVDKQIKGFFPQQVLADIAFYKQKILEIEDETYRSFLLLALIDAAMRCSYGYKDGAVVKIIKRPVPPLGKMFKWKIRKMLHDLKKYQPPRVPCHIDIGDARALPFEDDLFDFVITSPPYLNKIEYTNIYKIELSLFFDMPETKLRSYIGERVREQENLEYPEYHNLPEIAKAYFNDMNRVLTELFRVCKNGARAAVVIGGGCFPDRVVETDRIFAGLAERAGFEIEKILVARQSWCTRARTIKVGRIRESIVVFRKT